MSEEAKDKKENLKAWYSKPREQVSRRKILREEIESMRDIVEDFKNADTSDLPDFYSCSTPLERGLWILWAIKDKLGVRKLNAEQIASIIRDVKEISIDSRSIAGAFNRAGDKIHTYHEDDTVNFEIMKPGKDYLLSKYGEAVVRLFYFEPDRRFTSKRMLSKNILNDLEGELKIVDPYCGIRTLDILKEIGGKEVRILTRVKNLKGKKRDRFLREIVDFKSENANIEFRTYPHKDIHDRYIISSEHLVMLGHSIKDLGRKESFAIVLNKDSSRNIFEAINENFDRRWKQSTVI